MLEIHFWELLLFITFVWIIARVIAGIKTKSFSIGKEIKLLMVYIYIVVLARIVYFPFHHVNGHIDTLKFDLDRIRPLWINLTPIVHMFDIYDDWLINIIGNVSMFIPIGIIFPTCFEKLDKFWKTVLVGFGITLFIEISQLMFYERCSDIDDIIMNTTGVIIGASFYFLTKDIVRLTKVSKVQESV